MVVIGGIIIMLLMLMMGINLVRITVVAVVIIIVNIMVAAVSTAGIGVIVITIVEIIMVVLMLLMVLVLVLVWVMVVVIMMVGITVVTIVMIIIIARTVERVITTSILLSTIIASMSHIQSKTNITNLHLLREGSLEFASILKSDESEASARTIFVLDDCRDDQQRDILVRQRIIQGHNFTLERVSGQLLQ